MPEWDQLDIRNQEKHYDQTKGVLFKTKVLKGIYSFPGNVNSVKEIDGE